MFVVYNQEGAEREAPPGVEPVWDANGGHLVVGPGLYQWRSTVTGQLQSDSHRAQRVEEPAAGAGNLREESSRDSDRPAWAEAMERMMEAQRQASERQMQEMMRQFRDSMREQSTPPPAPYVAEVPAGDYRPRPPKTKAAEPKRFDGSKREEAEDFVETCVIYQGLRPEEFPTERTKILFAIGYLEGSARQWSKKYIGTDGKVSTWEEFTEELLHFYGLGNRRLETEEDLVHLRQGNSSFDDYMNKFNALAARLPDMDRYSKRMIFQANLSAAWKSAITEMDVGKHVGVEEFQEKCYKYAHKVVSTSRSHSSTTATRSHPTPARTYGPVVNVQAAPAAGNAPAANPGGSTPMEVDAGRLSRDPNGCYNCGVAGHRARDCTQPRRARRPPQNGYRSNVHVAAAVLEAEGHDEEETEGVWNM